ncbi:reverse transcriptase domain-containing protein [Tanacetum coccineum]
MFIEVKRCENVICYIQAEEEEQARLEREKAEKVKEANISWDNVQAMIEVDRLLAERLQEREQEELTDEEKDTELVKESSKKAEAEMAEESSSKRAGDELEQKPTKKQKVDDDKEREDLQQCFELVIEEDVAINVIPLATKPTHIFSQLLKEFDREDLENLLKLVKAKHGNTRPEEGYERVLWGDLKTMFEHHIEDEVWRSLQGKKVLLWRLYDSCGVHFVRFEDMHVYMLVEKRYPLTPATITDMLNKKLKSDYWNEICFMSTFELNDSILWHARLGHVHFKRMQDMSKDGLIPAFDMDTKKYNEPMWAADRVVALTPNFAITIPEIVNEFAIKESKTWLDELNEGTIKTWDELRTAFISRFFPSVLFDRLLEEIRAFSQHKNESLTDAWLRMKEMLINCPGHNLSKDNIIKILYHGLNEITQEVLNVAAGGIYKIPNQAYQLLKDKVLLKLDCAKNKKTKSSLKKTVAFTDEGNSNYDTDKIMA